MEQTQRRFSDTAVIMLWGVVQAGAPSKPVSN